MNTIMKFIRVILFILIYVKISFGSLNPQHGQNYMFWIYGQGFFSGYYQTSATLDTLGESTYIFSEDALVRDIKVNPFDESWVAPTNSGLFISYNSGDSWAPFNGSDDDFLPQEEESNLLNISEIAPQHIEQIHSVAFEDEETWWVGVKETDGVFRSQNSAETWKKKNTGLPTFSSRSPSVYQLYFAEGDNNVYGATEAGCFYRDGSRFKDRNDGFPEPETTDWPSIPCYEIFVENNFIYAATDYGLFRGTVENDFEDKLPINGGMAQILSSEIIEDIFYDPDSTLNETFSIDWETGDSIFYYDYYLSAVDTSLSYKISLSPDGIGSGYNVNIHDVLLDIMWTAQTILNEGTGGIEIELSNENIYYSNSDQYDIDTLSFHDINNENLNIYIVANEKVTDFKLNNNDLIYATQVGVYHMLLDTHEILYLGLDDLVVNDIEVSNNVEVIFSASSSGIQKYEFGVWNEITPKIEMLNDDNQYSYVVSSLEIVNDSLIIAGCGTLPYEDDRTQSIKTGGILVSNNGGITWQTKNLGLTHRSVTRQSLLDVLHVSENYTTLDSAKGILDLLNELYGEPTDIDNDPYISILVADMDDNAYNSTSDLVVQGYFNPEDQNIEQFGSYYTGYKTMNEDSIITVENNNSLKYGDFGRSKENNQLFSLFYYLNEKVFLNDNDGKINRLVQDTLSGIEGLNSSISSY